jgi:hypothetical protein
LKTLIGTEGIEARPPQDARIKSLFVAFFEPIHGLISIPESCIENSNLRGARISELGRFFRFFNSFIALFLLQDPA